MVPRPRARAQVAVRPQQVLFQCEDGLCGDLRVGLQPIVLITLFIANASLVVVALVGAAARPTPTASQPDTTTKLV